MHPVLWIQRWKTQAGLDFLGWKGKREKVGETIAFSLGHCWEACRKEPCLVWLGAGGGAWGNHWAETFSNEVTFGLSWRIRRMNQRQERLVWERRGKRMSHSDRGGEMRHDRSGESCAVGTAAGRVREKTGSRAWKLCDAWTLSYRWFLVIRISIGW